MTLSEVYFYIIIIVYQIFSLVIITFTEDLKDDKYYNRYFRITFLIGFLGIIMELLNWNYFCKFNCTLLTFSPFLTLIISKGIILFYKKLFKKEPFQIQRRKLSDGIWIKNKGDLKYIKYYSWYTAIIISFPIFTITGVFLMIEKNLC